MPRRKQLPAPPVDDIALSRSNLDIEFQETIELYGDPRVKLLSLAAKAEADDDLDTAARCCAEVAQYVSPKLRAMEVTGNVTSTQVSFNIDLSAADPDDSDIIDAES